MKLFGLALAVAALLVPTQASAMLEVDIGFEPDEVCPGDEVRFFFALENVGEQEEMVELCMTLSWEGNEFGPICAEFPLAAGEGFMEEFEMMVPPPVPPGTLTVLVTATDSDGTVEDTAELTILECRGAAMAMSAKPLIQKFKNELRQHGFE
ncbi:MAG: hypothetical protein GF330_11855 [Candidatus Eisenbacteria bacterium]|nr:hypothetical protein [Candidatus Eisenbacteria bacterium]